MHADRGWQGRDRAKIDVPPGALVYFGARPSEIGDIECTRSRTAARTHRMAIAPIRHRGLAWAVHLREPTLGDDSGKAQQVRRLP